MKQRRLFQNDGGNGITEGVIWKQLLRFFFPILLGTFFQQLYNTADAIIVGKFVGKESLAAVGGATGNLINLLVARPDGYGLLALHAAFRDEGNGRLRPSRAEAGLSG